MDDPARLPIMYSMYTFWTGIYGSTAWEDNDCGYGLLVVPAFECGLINCSIISGM